MIFKFIAIAVFAALVGFLVMRKVSNSNSAKDNIAAGEAFLEKNKAEQGVRVLESGLQLKILEPGEGTEHPSATSVVKVHYHGTLLDGSVFDSSVERGQPIEFGLNQVIKGWTEGLQLMVEGEKTRLFIPSDLAYGDRATGPISPGSTLIFDVELISFAR